MMTPPAKLYHLSAAVRQAYRHEIERARAAHHLYLQERRVRSAHQEDMARNLRAVQDYIEEHAADFQGESGVYVKEYIDELVSDTDEILHPHLELKEAA